MKLLTNNLQPHSLVTRVFMALAFTSLLSVGCAQSNNSVDTTQVTGNSGDNAAQDNSKKNASDNASATPAEKITAENILTGKNDTTVVETLQKNLKKSGINTKIISAEPVQVEGLYWVTAEGIPSFFTDKAGKHVIQGQVVAVGSSKAIDIGSKLEARVNKNKLAQVDKKDMIIYPAKGETKSIVYMFTDTTCPYCKKQHAELKSMNEKGIEVRYLAWPRNPRAEPIMEAVWCSKDRKAAMDAVQSNTGPKPTVHADCQSPVKAQTKLGLTMGVRGTPAIYTEDGEQIGGYLPTEKITKILGLQ